MQHSGAILIEVSKTVQKKNVSISMQIGDHLWMHTNLSAIHIADICTDFSMCDGVSIELTSKPPNYATHHTTIRIGASCDMMSVVQLQITIKS